MGLSPSERNLLHSQCVRIKDRVSIKTFWRLVLSGVDNRLLYEMWVE